MRKIKVAIIGAGQIAQTTHIPAFKSMENVEIVGVSDTYEMWQVKWQRILTFPLVVVLT